MRYTRENYENIKRIFERETGVKLSGGDAELERSPGESVQPAGRSEARVSAGAGSSFSAGSGIGRGSSRKRRLLAWTAAAALLAVSVMGVYGDGRGFSIRRMLLKGMGSAAPQSADLQKSETAAIDDADGAAAESAANDPEYVVSQPMSTAPAAEPGMSSYDHIAVSKIASGVSEEAEQAMNALAAGPGGEEESGSARISAESMEEDPFPITCGFYRDSVNESGVRKPGHRGIDFRAETGSEVLAAADGTVAETGYKPDLGNYIVLDHGSGYTTVYGHLSEISVEAGDEVSSGDPIGLAGATGMATGPCLHFELREDGEPVDPSEYME